MRRWAATSAAAQLLAALIAAPVGAATPIGEAFEPAGDNCTGNATYIQSGSPGGQYAAPFAGVITAWSHQALGSSTQLRLKVAHSEGGNDFTIVGESELVQETSETASAHPVRIPVVAGDVIGFYLAPNVPCLRVTGAYAYLWKPGEDTAVGTTASFATGAPAELDIAAILEPDADHDGFGDETQDQCPTDASTQGPCPDATPPDTQIVSGPKEKTKKKTATFEFTSNEPGSFECSLDAGAFAACSSPDTLKVKKGKHTFEVRAIDQAGNVGAPATDSWKRKKKK
jgi:hypothetical protein